MKSNRQIVDDCNQLARRFYQAHGYQVPDDFRFDQATHPQEHAMWNLAVLAYDHIEGTDVEDVLLQLEDENDPPEEEKVAVKNKSKPKREMKKTGFTSRQQQDKVRGQAAKRASRAKPKDAVPALPPESGYEWLRAIVSGEDLRWEYQVVGSSVQGRDQYDQDVSEWSEQDIRKTTCSYLNLEEQYSDRIEVVYS